MADPIESETTSSTHQPGSPPILDADEAIERARALAASAAARQRRLLLGICGAPGSGKSTFAQRLTSELGAAAVPMDGYHLADVGLDALGLRAWKGRIDTFDGAGFVSLLQRLRADRSDEIIWAPSFERALEQPIAGSLAVRPRDRFVVTEGNYLLDSDEPWAAIPSVLDEVWFVDVDDTLRTDRLLARHVQFGKSPNEAVEWVDRVDGPNAARIQSTRHRASCIIRC
ncbi:MAG: nucleoside/nucleotide kinase family protein [Ilumatobacteraceae bacterium]